MARTRQSFVLTVLMALAAGVPTAAQEPTPASASPFALFRALAGRDEPVRLICYSPSELDPRVVANNLALTTASIRADLEALRPHFGGLILYGYDEGCTPRIVAIAEQLGFEAVVLGIYQPKSAVEVDGVAALARQYADRLAIGVIVGNEGLTFGRYEPADVRIAADRLRPQLPSGVPLATSEPLVAYAADAHDGLALDFGDFLAPNLHPVFDAPQLGAAEAAAWVRSKAAAVAEAAGKPVLVKETGFPHGPAPEYSPEAQRAFWEAYLRPGLVAESGGTWVSHASAFEAFDLPWKAVASGLPVEDDWGLFGVDRSAYPAVRAWSAADRP